ncbi:MAG: phosphatase PAP2 family protein [Mycobacteriales bacterium]
MTLLMIAVILVAGPFAFFLEQVISSGPLSRADKSLANSMHVQACTNAAAVTAARVISFLGSTIWDTALIVVAVAFLLFRRKEQRLAIFAGVTAATGSLLNSGVKLLVDRDRPLLSGCQFGSATGQSFPSGHAMNTTIVYGVLVLVFLSLIKREWRPVLIGVYAGWLLAMSWARMTLGVHYLSDVLGGIVLGCAWLAIGVAVFQAWRKEAGKPPADVIHEGVEPEAELRADQNS